MKKIYLVSDKNREINLGDMLTINGFNVVVSQDFIDANPQNFVIKEVKKKAVNPISENNIPEYVKAKITCGSGAETYKGRVYKTIPSNTKNLYTWIDDDSTDSTDLEGMKIIFTPSTRAAYEKQMIEDAIVKYPVGTFAKSAVINKIYEVKSPDFMWDGMGDLLNGNTHDGFTVNHNGKWAQTATVLEAVKARVNITKTNPFIAEGLKLSKNIKLSEAKKRFPKGTHYKSLLSGEHRIIEGNLVWGISSFGSYADHICVGSSLGHSIYDGNADVWAEVLTPRFITFDNVPVYEGDRTVAVNRKAFAVSEPLLLSGDCPSDNWYFSTTTAAKEFAKRNKPKTYDEVVEENLKLIDKINYLEDKLKRTKEIIIS